MTDYPWWEEAEAAAPLMQGDVVEDCPVAVFNEDVSFEGAANLIDRLASSAGIDQVRSIVMTQACDLAELKVRNVILCPAYPLTAFRTAWEEDFIRRSGNNPGTARWESYVHNIKAGRLWNLAVLRRRDVGEGVELTAPTTIVDFHEVFSVPLRFLQLWVAKTGKRRLRLQPPYREHLSQAFARFFMRVGLPVDIEEM